MQDLFLPDGYTNTEFLSGVLKNRQEKEWILAGEQMALKLFHEMSQRVPAYKDFLEQEKIDPSRIRNIDDFKQITPIDKDNYLRKYPKYMLCWDGKFAESQWTISTTSGSSGQPYYFPRGKTQEWQYAATAEQYLRSNFSIHERTTLYIVAFPMGAWIGGVFTYEALKIISDQGDYNLSVITTGISKQEVINAVKQLGGNFDQVIIGSYAPFLKDILDDGARDGINWSDYNLGFVFSAEAFSEAFRDYVARIAQPKDINRFSLNHYGTVDIGTMAHETPETVMLRRKLANESKLHLLFPEPEQQATVCQYNPELFYFEEENNNLLCSSYSGLPLVRYNLKDYGGVISRKEVAEKLAVGSISLEEELRNAQLSEIAWDLPYVYVYERKDFTVSYYAFLVYPDMIRRVLQESALQELVTGKFSMRVDYNQDGQQKLMVHIEKMYGVDSSRKLESQLVESLHTGLLGQSSEYAETFKMVGEPAKPVAVLWDYEDPKYFKSGGKQKWVTK